MIKVCHMTSAHESNDIRIFNKECTSLARAGYIVYLVAQGESYIKDGVHVLGIGEQAKSRFKRMTATTRAVYQRALKIDADIYHIHDPELLPYAMRLKKKGKRVIFDSHEDVPQQIREKAWIPKIVRNIAARIIEKYQNRVCKRIDAVISVTPHICDKLRLCNPNTYMIANYPIINEWDSTAKSNRNCGKRIICFAGGISEQWEHDKILRAIEGINDVKYCLCGFGSQQYLEKLKGFSSWNKVDYRGQISHSEVVDLLTSSRVGMALLRKGGNTGGDLGTLGNTKLFEYMSAGIPVICTNFILWQQIVREYNCGICVDPNNIYEITEAIKFILDNPLIADSMGESGKRAVREKYNWKLEEEKLLQLYLKLSYLK